MNEDDADRRAELQQIDRELDRELLHHDLHQSPGDRPPASPARPSALRLRVERSLLAVVSLLTLALGVEILDHRCPAPPPALPVQIAAPDAGALADSAPKQADGEPPGEDEESEKDTCPAVEVEEKREWVPVHLLLTAVTEAKARSWSSPIDWELTLPPQLAGFLPAVSRDGRTVVQIYDDIEDFSGTAIRRMVFFSVPAGKAVKTFLLHSGHDTDQIENDAETARETAKEVRERLETDRKAANRLLDATEWRHLATGRSPGGPCPGSPWAKLDEERRRDELWTGSQFARFDADGIDLEYDPEHGTLTVRALQKDGTLRTVKVDYVPGSPGRVSTGGHCGDAAGIAGFGSRELGGFFLFGTSAALGGDNCQGIDSALRTDLFRLPREL